MNAKEFFYDLGRAIYHIDAVYDEAARSGNVAGTLLWILYALNDGKPHTQKEICEDWDLPKSTVNTITTKLKKEGYVQLVPIKGKRREMTVSLTDSGKGYADNLLKPIYQKEAAVFQQLSEADLQVIPILKKLAGLLKDAHSAPQEQKT